MGKIILFILIIIAFYYTIKVIKKSFTEEVKPKSETFFESAEEIDKLIENLYKNIEDLKTNSEISMYEAEVKKDYYKKQIEKLNKLKNKLKN